MVRMRMYRNYVLGSKRCSFWQSHLQIRYADVLIPRPFQLVKFRALQIIQSLPDHVVKQVGERHCKSPEPEAPCSRMFAVAYSHSVE